MTTSKDIFDYRKAQVFVSYTSDDRALVANFIERLTDDAIAAAAVVWYDSKLNPSLAWDDEIMSRLHSADVILVLASPKYFESVYVAERELPVIRGRADGTIRPMPASIFEHPPARTAVRVIRLREFDGPRPEIENLPIWPDGDRTIQTVPLDGPEICELRTWLKVEICKALVARHADHYDHLSREEEIRRRNEALDPFVHDWQVDDLTFLHGQLGENYTSGARLAAGGIGGVLVGAAAGLGAKAWLFPGAMTSFFGPVLFLAIVGFVAGAVKPGFRAIEMMLAAFRSRRHGMPEKAESGKIVLEFTPVIMFARLLLAVFSAVIFGLSIGAVLSNFGWSFDIGLIGAAAIGGMLCALAGLDFGSSFTSKRLKVFTDVRHLYQPPVVERLPPPVNRIPAPTVMVPRVGDDSPSARLPASPVPVSKVVSLNATCETEPNGNTPSIESALEPDDSYEMPKSAEDVFVNLTIVAAAALREEASQLMTALQADSCDDVFRIKVVTDADSGVDDPNYWRQAFAREGRCLVLMTEELVRTPVLAAIARSLAGRTSRKQRKVYPVLIDAALPTNIPLMEHQGLPSGQMPIRNWPIRENAWANVSRNLLADEIDEFLARLHFYLEHALFSERFPDNEKYEQPTVECTVAAVSSEEPKDSDPQMTELLTGLTGVFEAQVRHEYRSRLMRGELFVDPRYDFSHYPFRHRVWYASLWGAVLWTATGAVCLGSFANAIAAQLAPSAVRGFGWVGQHVLPAVALAVALAYLTLRETLRYAKVRLTNLHDKELNTIVFLLGAVFPTRDSAVRTTILARTAQLLRRPLVLLATVTAATFVLAPGGSLGHVAGAMVGFACYLVSRYRVPAIVICRPAAPTPHDMGVAWHALKCTIRLPRENNPGLERSSIGNVQSPRPQLIEGYFEEFSISAWMVLRAVLDTGWILAVGTAALAGFMRLGLRPLLAFGLALFVVSVIIHFIGHRPQFVRSKGQSWLAAVWSSYRYLVFGAIRMQGYIGFAMLACRAVSHFLKADSKSVPVLLLGTLALVTFVMRLTDQVLMTCRAHWPDLATEPVMRPDGAPEKPGDAPCLDPE